MKNKNRLVVRRRVAQDLPGWLLDEIAAERLTLAMAALIYEMQPMRKLAMPRWSLIS